MYALQHGPPPATAQLVTAQSVTTIAVSIVVHGIWVTPWMKQYGKRTQTPDP
jgi:sodium/hydrogen antiporter